MQKLYAIYFSIQIFGIHDDISFRFVTIYPQQVVTEIVCHLKSVQYTQRLFLWRFYKSVKWFSRKVTNKTLVEEME